MTAIDKSLAIEPDKIIKVPGKLIIPGGIRPHVRKGLHLGHTERFVDFLAGMLWAVALEHLMNRNRGFRDEFFLI